MAALVLGVAGAALLGPAGIGFSGFWGINGAAVGWALGNLAGGLLGAKTINQEGPRLGDLSVQVSTYGQARPVVEGAMRMGGNVIWASPIREVKNTSSQSGKGGPKVTSTTYTYFVDVAIGLGQSELQAIRKAWSDGELVLDLSGARPFEVAVAKPLVYDSFTLYPGDYAQLPDPTIEAFKGVGNTPAYRGEAYVVFKNLDITRFGRIPQLTFEVCRSATTGPVTSVIAYSPSPSKEILKTCFKADGIYPIWYNINTSDIAELYQVPSTDSWSYYGTFAIAPDSRNGAAHNFRPVNTSGEPCVLRYWGEDLTAGLYRFIGLVFVETGRELPVASYPDTLYGLVEPVIVARDPVTGMVANTVTSPVGPDSRYTAFLYAPGGQFVLCVLDAGYTAQHIAAYNSLVHVLANNGTTNKVFTYDQNGNLQYSAALGLANMIYAGPDGIYTYNSNPFGTTSRVYRSKDYGATFELFVTGISTPGDQAVDPAWYCCDDYALIGPCSFNGGTADDARQKYFIVNFRNVTPTDVPLADIVARRCDAAGLAGAQYDVVDLAGDMVHGYSMARLASSRQAIEPLAKSYAFDAVESDGLVRFVKRGVHGPVATIAYAELAACEFGQEPGDPLPLTRTQEDELPRAVTVSYINTGNDYQAGSERAQRINTTSLAVVTEELPEATTSDHAATTANRLLWESWNSRTQYSFATTRKYAHLDPADVVLVEHRPGDYKRLRLVTANDTGLLCEFTAVEDVPSIYGQAWVGATPAGGQSLANPAPGTTLKVLDIPLLRDVDDYAGPYAAVGSPSTSWRGATVFAGASEPALAEQVTLSHTTVVGTTRTVLPNYTGPRFFDMVSTVTVYTSGDLYNASRADVLTNRANACAIGDEVLNFLTATLNADGSYTLSGLLRGQLGTERAMASHTIGEAFAMLQNTGVAKLAEQIGDINTPRVYKAVSLGQRLSQAPALPFTPTGVALKPYAPFNLRKAASGADWVLSCQRRTRYSENFLVGLVPLGEGSEAYEWDICTSNTFATVVRTLSSATSSVTYTAAMQAADFGAAQSTLYVRVAQLSSAVGRGFPLTATV